MSKGVDERPFCARSGPSPKLGRDTGGQRDTRIELSYAVLGHAGLWFSFQTGAAILMLIYYGGGRHLPFLMVTPSPVLPG
jgi:hypothetical protein